MKLKEASHALTFILLVDRYRFFFLRVLVTNHRVKGGMSALSLLLSPPVLLVHYFPSPFLSSSHLSLSLSVSFEPDSGCGLMFTAEITLLA